MAWYDGELFPVGKEFPNAPVGAMFHNEECSHDHVVATQEQGGGVPVTSGRMVLHCMDCLETWWEDVACIKGSPWSGR